jgi:hypothetical protein
MIVKQLFQIFIFPVQNWFSFFIVGTGAAHILGFSASTDPIIAGREE